MQFQLKGIYGQEHNSVWLNGQQLDINPSLKIRKHSFEFAWGYRGSGPAQLTLAILLKLKGRQFAEAHYQEFKQDIIAMLPNENLDEQTIEWEIPQVESLLP
jgi:hypothetical protein